jgi:hypothetical protein
LCCG